ncbi:hypothetical protein BB558_004011 [Smittium angustum]|uniref:GTP-binding protein n=1 Tax=Smittium angustum TaxID=133377 RepID=A0A2U1J4L5_SMIAN|nr:hypothetical protein BB558_004011 [Smittium angustum]
MYDQMVRYQRDEYEHSDESNPRILLIGPSRSGKTSILLVIFEKMDQLDTISIEPTTEAVRYTMYGGIEVYDLPGHSDEDDYQSEYLREFLSSNTVIVFVIDTQDNIQKALLHLFANMELVFNYNPNIPFHIFLHKIDGLSEELREDINQDIQQRVISYMDYEGWDSAAVQFYITSIYTKSIYEAMSRVSHKLVSYVNVLETLLNSLCYNSSLDKAYLFDMQTKLFIATDSSPSVSKSHEFCCSTIGLVEDLTKMYRFQMGPNGQQNSHLTSVIHLQANISIFSYQVNDDKISQKTSLLAFNARKVTTALQRVLEFSSSRTNSRISNSRTNTSLLIDSHESIEQN